MSFLSLSNLNSAGKKAAESSKVCAQCYKQSRLAGRLSPLAVSNSVLPGRAVVQGVENCNSVCVFQLLAHHK